ncbi:MAG TPA: metallophosphoesterase family protein [Planctomycetota bacterium]|nr:metallophosphoesterase family protein [Planctomycetota bacterium]
MKTDEATIQWRTSSTSPGSVEWGSTPALGQTTAPTPTQTNHEVSVAGLLPNRTYYYRVLATGVPVSPIHSFRTAETPLYPFFRFGAFGDSGMANSSQASVASLVGSLAPDLVLILGDVIYPSGAASDMDAKYFVPYASLLGDRPFYPALGNHDYATGCAQPYLDAFCVPTSGPGGERYYSFDRGPVHFVCADSDPLSGPPSGCSSLSAFAAQAAWLDADLAASNASWKIVFFHHPPYSDSNHGDDPDVQAIFVPIFEARGVDLVLSGHDHCYERFPPMVGGAPASGGVRYMVAGTGGASLYGINPGPLLEFGAVTHGALVGDVRGNQIRLRFFGADSSNFGQVLDEIVMSKGPTTPVLEASALTVPLGGSLSLGLTAEAGQGYVLAFGTTSAYGEAPPHGILLLAPAGINVGANGAVPAGGTVTFPLAVPSIPALLGMTVRFQAAATSTDPSVAGFWISNLAAIQVG